MHVYANGWSRDNGTKNINKADLLDCEAYEDSRGKISMRKTKIFVDEDGVRIISGNHLSFNGDYQFCVSLSDEDIMRLWRLRFGNEVTAEVVDQAGLAVSEDFRRQIGRSLTIGELLGDTA